MNNKKDIIKFSTIYIIWMLIALPVALIAKLIGFNLDNNLTYAILEFIVSMIIFILVIYSYRKDIWKDMKKLSNDKNIFSRALVLTIGAFLVELLAATLVSVLFNLFGLDISGSNNNKLAQELLLSAPVLMGIGAVILGPIYEELIMRLGLKKCFKNKKVFFAVSGIIFGIMHVVDNLVIILSLPIIAIIVDKLLESNNKNKKLLSTASVILYLFIMIVYLTITSGGITNLISSINISESIYLIEYIVMGLYFTKAYLEFDNIWYSIIPHIMINLLATLFLYFG